MRIAIITNGSLPVPSVKGGGVETLVNQFLDENEKTKKHQVTVFSIADDEAKSKAKVYECTEFVFLDSASRTFLDKLKYRLAKKNSLNSPYSYKNVIKDIKNKDYDKVIIENTTWPLFYAAKKIGNKLFLHLHNDWVNNTCCKKEQKMFKKAISMMGGVITVSEYIKNRILTISDIDENKIFVLKNCTDPKLFSVEYTSDQIEELKKKYNVKTNQFVLVFTGRISEQKGLLQLIRAISLLDSQYNIKLLIAGSAKSGEDCVDEYTKQVSNLIDASDKDILFTGYIPHNKLSNIYAVADVAVLPSMWEDPAPLTVFESMSMGLPIITTNSGGIPEYVNSSFAIICNKEMNIEANLKNAIETLVNNKEKCKKMGEYAKKESKRYTTKIYYDNYTQILSI